ncbi:MAG: energy-coupling factor ABC transporter ATP-binding protein [Caldiserica bacterium]|jgi:cobalt/nickel transport system ATP-binding protein|nr:energy-coupling factor ABC transporter ATP-binding protein [Caldisericota bacterium]MDH7562518.1 ABC transporter ATP-binding protein [Caldisericota bacterium]
MPIFEVRGVSFCYPDGTPGLNDVSLYISQGECLGVVGPNGSGKSTLLKILAGLYFPQKGEVLFSGERLTEERLREKSFRENFRRKVSILFQNPESQILFPTVWEEVQFGLLQMRIPPEEAQKKSKEMLEFLHIEDLKERHPYKLSGGEKKKVILASLLALDPEVLLLDEPTDNLDPRSASELTAYISKLSQRKTVLISTHNLNLVEKVCSRVYLLSEEKRVEAEGEPGELFRDRGLLERLNLIEVG